jgi:ADP-ribosylation factor 2-binding protein
MALNNFNDATAELEEFSLEDGDEEDIVISKCSEADTKFDTVIGHIEDIIMGDKFQTLQTDFLEAHYKEFDDAEENKFIYSDIHLTYTHLIETFLESELTECLPEFSMKEFLAELVSRKDELEGEVFEILRTFNDFLAFKEMVLDYKASKEGRHSVDLSSGITVTALYTDAVTLQPAAVPQFGSGDVCQTVSNNHTAPYSDQPPPHVVRSCESVNFDFCVVGKAVKPKRDGSS